ncbi:MAG: septum formation initiator family protein [Bacteroidetes bacterium]|nr:septum formation initiator family protein [Bacteroidota bacterium]
MKKFLNIIRNKYLLTIIGIIVWLLFFDKNDVFSQMELMGKLNKLRADKTYYLAEIKNNRDAIEDLKTNKKSLERFAREKYLMKKDNEDVYVIVKK